MEKVKLFFIKVLEAEKKHKIISYISLIFLVVTTTFLRSENKELTKDFLRAESEINLLKNNVIIYNRDYEDFPFPYWEKKKKGGQFIGQYFNKEYVKVFGHIFNANVYNLIGKNNFQLGYPNDIAQRYFENDIAVSITGEKLRTIETFPDINENETFIKVIKWRQIRKNDTLVLGMVYDYIKK